MLRYVLGRLAQAIPVFFGTTFIIYFLVFAVPGDPVLALFGNRTPNPAVVAQLRQQFHLDQPFMMQYFLYMKDLFHGNLGTTFSGQPVAEVFARAFPVTLQLVLLAVIMEFVLSVGLGLIAGLRKGRFFDNSSLLVALIFNSVPVFVAMFLAQYYIGVKLGWARPTVGADVSWGSLFLPALVIALTVYVTGMRLMRGSVIEARPVITNSAASFGSLLAGTLVTEGIFNIPGVGRTLYKAILNSEGPTIVSFVTILTIMYVMVNILVDLLYAVLDPRIRYA
jgi:oligopeptide transport system permease protein